MIKGGYYIKARKIQESEISHSAPCVREIWDWILREANHSETKVCKRGELFTSYSEIIEGLCWYAGWRKMSYSRHDCENSMKYLRARLMITTQKTTRGLFITIINYDYYQNPKNYESQTKATTNTERLPQHGDTIHKNVKNEKNEKKEEETPSQEAQSFFKGEEGYRTILELFSKNKDPVPIEKEFQKFVLYWTELNKTGTKQKWQQQDTFEVKKRLVTWLGRANQYTSKNYSGINKRGVII